MSDGRWRFRVDDGAGAVVDRDGHPVTSLNVEVGDYWIPAFFEVTVTREDVDWPLITLYIEMQGRQPVIRELTIGSRGVIELMNFDKSAATYRARNTRDPWQESARQDDPPATTHAVTGSLIRQIPISKLARYAMLGVAWRLDKHRGTSERVVPHELRDEEGFYVIGPGETELQIGYEYARVVGEGAESNPYAWDWDDLWTDYMQELDREAQEARPPERRNRVTDNLLASVAEVYRQAINDGLPPKRSVATAFTVSQPTAGRYIMQARQRGHLGKTHPGKKGEQKHQETPDNAIEQR
jgi:hypothetical protein